MSNYVKCNWLNSAGHILSSEIINRDDLDLIKAALPREIDDADGAEFAVGISWRHGSRYEGTYWYRTSTRIKPAS